MHKRRQTEKLKVRTWQAGHLSTVRDVVVAEEPLTVLWQGNDGEPQRLGATMRTPGADHELTAGLLFYEGLLLKRSELHTISACVGGGRNLLNRLKAQLRLPEAECRSRVAHRPSEVLPQSACGLCAVEELGDPRQLVSSILARCPAQGKASPPDFDLLELALEFLGRDCPVFAATGAAHACLVLGTTGEKLALFEDVGRHNACDKALGSLLLESPADRPFVLPAGAGLLFSSRLSFELAAKGCLAGAGWLASVGAPTNLAVELARRRGVPLFGFASRARYNRYV